MSSARDVGTQPPRAPPARGSSDANSSHTPLWRPWLFTSASQSTRDPLASAESRARLSDCSSLGRKLCFQHPVRLFWPKSKSHDHLYSDGEALLKNFPVQATISFYEESDSDDEDEECCEEHDIWME